MLSSISASGGDLVLSVCSAMESEVGGEVSGIHSDCLFVLDGFSVPRLLRAVVYVGPEPVSSW